MEVQVGVRPPRARGRDRACPARIKVAVVAKIHDAPADLRLQASRGPDLGHEEPTRKEPAGLLAEPDDDPPCAHPLTPARGGRTACNATLKAMHAAQPMRLYQR